MDLSTLQREFVAALFAPEAPAPLAIVETAPGREARFAVYRNNTLSNLVAALLDVHPVVARLVGERFFDHVATQYARAYASRSGDIHEYGDQFADFIRAHSAMYTMPWIADVACLEWAWHESFHAASPTPFDWSSLSSIDESMQGRIWFVPNPTLRLVRSDYPILHIWQVNQPDREADEIIDLDEGSERLVLVRGLDHDIVIERVDAATYALLSACRQGRPLVEAVAQAITIDASADAAGMLHRLVARGQLVGIGRL